MSSDVVEAMEVATEKPWHQKMAKHDLLARKGAQLLYDRVKLLAEIHEDEDFRCELAAQGKDVYKLLDEKVGDTGQPFTILVKVLEHFPNRKDWQNQPVQRLWAKVIVEERKERQARERERLEAERKRLEAEREAYIKEHGCPPPDPEPEESEYDKLLRKHGSLIQEYEELKQKYEEKCKECEELKAQLAKLRN